MKNLIVLASLLLLVYSCEKNDHSEKKEQSHSEYLPMSVGDYWIYQRKVIKPNGIEYISNSIDSVVISKDTIINGELFYRFDHFECQPYRADCIESNIFRDSTKNMISAEGHLFFSENNFTDTLYKLTYKTDLDTLYSMTGKMEKVNDNFTVPLGTYNEILNVKSTIICNPKYTSIENPRYNDRYFAKGVGVIFESQTYFNTGYYLEKKLIRYHVNQN